MNLCSHQHDEVCYEGHHCPACIIINDLNIAEDTVKELREEVKILEYQVKELEALHT